MFKGITFPEAVAWCIIFVGGMTAYGFSTF